MSTSVELFNETVKMFRLLEIKREIAEAKKKIDHIKMEKRFLKSNINKLEKEMKEIEEWFNNTQGNEEANENGELDFGLDNYEEELGFGLDDCEEENESEELDFGLDDYEEELGFGLDDYEE